MLKKNLMVSVLLVASIALPVTVFAAPAAPAHQGGGPYFLMGNTDPATADQSVTSGSNAASTENNNDSATMSQEGDSNTPSSDDSSSTDSSY